MKTYTQEELNAIIENHQHWLRKDCDGWENMRADLKGVDLKGVDLKGADLSYANLSCADLSYADLSYVDLSDAILKYANLSYVDLSYVDLSYAVLKYAKNIPFIPYACPDTGSFIGYKKANVHIVKLEIPSDARRCSATGRKCRCDKAKVLSIQFLDEDIPCDDKEVASNFDRSFIYRVGEIVEEPEFDENRWNECAKGIHFFINRQEAVEY